MQSIASRDTTIKKVLTKKTIKNMCSDKAHYHHAFHKMQNFGGGFRRPKYNVPINISENETDYLVQVYATGFSKENISIAVKEDVLHITGLQEIENPPKFIQQEFPVKTFERLVALNRKVGVENITAVYEDGILSVILPKSKEALQKEMNIEVK
ncbi:Hsp20/alpha crystallin family protein [Lacihabitans sp. CCS-44]|nr:Hsp20/alpha crystallin family protein [Lacihabitans sp. CCS-44]